jgi:hypothetical protein
MPRAAKIISIPKPGPEAFNKNRAAGTLLRSQTVHLRHALSQYAYEVSAHLKDVAELLAVDLGSIKTEGEVSAYTSKVMAILHPQATEQLGK